MKDFRSFLKNTPVVLMDGAMGTLLQARGLAPGELPERWSVSHPDVVADIHRQYYDAGSRIVCTNTFGANRLHYSEQELEAVVSAALECAREAQRKSTAPGEKFIALDVGPTGKLLRPLGDFDFEEAVDVFAQTVKLGVRYGADLILIETMNDSYETKAALLAAKENSDLPVFVTNAYGADGKLMTGATPEAMVALLEGMGADAIGANCSLGPRQLRGVVEELLRCASVPVILKPNAGLPRAEGGKTCYDVLPEEFAAEVAELTKQGVRVAGGCCGTTPEYLRALAGAVQGISARPILPKRRTVASSYTHAIAFGDDPILIGERINPTGKKRFRQAVLEGDVDYILNEGINQQDRGVHALDVNVGVPGVEEAKVLTTCVTELQAVSDLPLQIDTADPAAMEAALRRYNGKAIVNSVNGKAESMKAIFPLVKKYGGVVIALTLDENGIPETADGRVAIARKILETAEAYGIGAEDLIFDPLAMTVSADANAANVTLETLRRIRDEIGCRTSLGVSNVSFGLPDRDGVNATFFALALANGLSAAIMNPYSADMMRTYRTYRALRGLDPNCADYLAHAADRAPAEESKQIAPAGEPGESVSALQRAILKGLQEQAREITGGLLAERQPMEVVNEEIIPALNEVGKGFEEKRVYLPQLLMSAEAAKAAFERVRAFVANSGEKPSDQGIFVLATVHGDIHDIGKNIVHLLLENYGFRVVDLGKDVPAQTVAETVERLHAPFAGLSALMTTTVPAMEETVRLLRERAPWCRIVVGGAVLTQEYADAIGADHYAPDAMDAVRYAQGGQ